MKELVWRKPEVRQATGLSDTTIWRLIKAGQFPKKIQLGPRAVGWLAEKVAAWARKKREGSEGRERDQNSDAGPSGRVKENDVKG
jgi:prophage regulatory protein